MRRLLLVGLVAGLAALLPSVPRTASAALIIENDGTGGDTYSTTGTWTDSIALMCVDNGQQWADPSGNDVAKWMPTGGDALTGLYYVQVLWNPSGIWNTTDARYTVTYDGGSTNIDVSQAMNPAQGSGGATSTGAGWYTLGKFQLNSSSFVELSYASPSATKNLSADAVRFAKDLIIDEFSSAVTVNAGTFVKALTENSGLPEEDTQYAWSSDSAARVTYTPGVAGLHSLYLSWAALSGNTTKAEYLIDLDGNLLTTGDQTVVEHDQTLLADGSSGANHDWSGWSLAGEFLLTSDSKVVLTNGTGSGNLVANGLKVGIVPEPCALVLLVTGCLAVVLLRRHGR